MAVIPNRFLFVWSGSRFPYFARLAIESVLVSEPTASVELHVFGEHPQASELAWLERHARASVHTFEPASGFADLGVDADALCALYDRISPRAVSARANLVRYAVLARRGGIYLDTDVLVIAPFGELRSHEAFIGEEQVLAIDNAWQAGERSASMIVPSLAWLVGRSAAFASAALRSRLMLRVARAMEPHWQTNQANNAVIGARAGAPFVQRLLEAALDANPTVRFALGPTLVDRVARRRPDLVTMLPSDIFYAVPPSYSFRFFTGGALALPRAARLLHVVSSNHAELLASLDHAQIQRRAHRGPYYANAADLVARLEAAR